VLIAGKRGRAKESRRKKVPEPCSTIGGGRKVQPRVFRTSRSEACSQDITALVICAVQGGKRGGKEGSIFLEMGSVASGKGRGLPPVRHFSLKKKKREGGKRCLMDLINRWWGARDPGRRWAFGLIRFSRREKKKRAVRQVQALSCSS